MISVCARGQIEALVYRVRVAASAAEALALLEVHRNVDLLFTNIAMPGGMNGWPSAILPDLMQLLVEIHF